MTHPNLIERQFERLREVETALANGAHYADDPECHTLYPHAVAARQILEGHVSTLTAEVEELISFIEHISEVTGYPADELAREEFDDKLATARATLTKGEGDKPCKQ